MTLLTEFQAKRITFRCTTAKSYLAAILAVMYSHPMIQQRFACISFKNNSIYFIFWIYVLVYFRQIFMIFKILTSCKKVAKTIITFWVYH